MSEVPAFDTEEALNVIKSAQAGDEAAIATLYKQHNSRVFGVLMHMVKDYDTALDLTSDVWVKVIAKLSTFKGEAMFLTWIHRVAVNEGLMHIRKMRRRHTLSLDAMIPLEENESGHSELPVQLGATDSGQTSLPVRDTVNRALLQLAPKYRNAVIMHHIEGYPAKELAEMSGRTLSAMKSDLYRGAQQLRALLSDN